MRARHLVRVCLTLLTNALLALTLVEAQGIDTEWSTPVDITQPSSSTHGAFGLLLCDQYQNVHLFWADLSQADAAILYRNDVGEIWSAPIDVLVMPGSVVAELHGDISNNDNTIHLVWLDRYFSGDLYYSQASLLEAGQPRAWAHPINLASSVWNAAINVDSAGVIHLVYGVAEDAGASPTVYHASSDNGGISWTSPAIVYSASSDLPSFPWVLMDIDDADRIHVGITTRTQEYGVYSEVGYVRSADGGQTWTDYQAIDKVGTTFQGVHVIAPYAFGENEIHLTWHDPRRMHRWSLDGGQTWNGPVEIMVLGAAFGGPNMLAKDSAGILRVVTAVADGVFSAAWDGAKWEVPERIDSRYIDAHGQDMIVCQGNRLNVVYYDRLGDNRVWYSSREVNAPHVERRPLPAPTTLPLAMTVAAASPTSAPAEVLVSSTASDIPQGAPATTLASQGLPIVASGASVLVLVILVFALRLRTGSRRAVKR